jgi:hypothetical protein
MDIGNIILGILLIIASAWIGVATFIHWKNNYRR